MNLIQLGFLAMLAGFLVIVSLPSPQGGAPGCLTMAAGLLFVVISLAASLAGY